MERYKNELIEIFEKAKKYDELSFIYKKGTLYCSFCNKPQELVKKLVAAQKLISVMNALHYVMKYLKKK